MAANMYRVGDYVYFETSSTGPYQIRRIEELNKTPNGNVEARVMCFYRRRDISSSLILLADKHQSALEEDQEVEENEDLTEKQRHQLKHRELFLSRQVETLPATHIRGKCGVTLLNETEALMSYLNREDLFFYSLVYDPQQKTLLADKGEIRVGSRYQAEIQPLLKEGETDGRNVAELEEIVYNPQHGLTDRMIDQFMVIARSVGTFARALDCTSTVRQPSLHMSAAAASRDVTLFHAMDTLHKHGYDLSKAIASLVPPGGPVLCRDEMEEWSASEANLFEEAIDKYGKDFNDIRTDFLPWKSLKSVIEYYYMWKTTDRYVQQKRIKAAEQETKLKQVYIPNYNKPNPAQITGKMNGLDGSLQGRACESCYAAHSSQWYSWGPLHMQCRLCASCWIYWKKYGGLKMPTRLDGERPPPTARADNGMGRSEAGYPDREILALPPGLAGMAAMRTHKCTIGDCGKDFRQRTHLARHLATAHGLAIRASSPRPAMKTRAAFCLVTTPLTRISRRVCKDILKIRKAAREPFKQINITEIKQQCQTRLPSLSTPMKPLSVPKRSNLNALAARRGLDVNAEKPALLHHTEGARNDPPKLSFPPPPEGQTPRPLPALSPENHVRPSSQQPIMKRRPDQNGFDGPALKRQALGVIKQTGNVRGPVINHLNGRGGKVLIGRGRRQVLSWVDAPDDVYFVATDATRKLRKQMTTQDFKRAARKPWRRLGVKTPGGYPTADPIVIE